MKLKNLILGILPLLIVSCEHDSKDTRIQSDDEVGLYVLCPDTSKNLSKEKLIEILLNKYLMGSRSIEKVIESIEEVCDANGNPQIFVVNYENNGGYVIISADKEYLPVLAESDYGNFDAVNLKSECPLSSWMARELDIINHKSCLPDSSKLYIASRWIDFDKNQRKLLTRGIGDEKPQVYYDSLRQWSLDPNIEVYTFDDYIKTDEFRLLGDFTKQEIYTGVYGMGNSNYGSIESSTFVLRYHEYDRYDSGIMLETTWGTGYGYNSYVPWNEYGVGYTPVAVGQIMRYYKYPNYISWSDMKNTEGSDAAAKFLRELGDKMGIVYGNKEPDVLIVDVQNTLRQYGYTVTLNNHNSGAITNQIRNKRPVFIRGFTPDGKSYHDWVCDGVKHDSYRLILRFMTLEYKPTATPPPDRMVEAYSVTIAASHLDDRYHYNWGNDGKGNGYFLDTGVSVENEQTGSLYNNKMKELLIWH